MGSEVGSSAPYFPALGRCSEMDEHLPEYERQRLTAIAANYSPRSWRSTSRRARPELPPRCRGEAAGVVRWKRPSCHDERGVVDAQPAALFWESAQTSCWAAPAPRRRRPRWHERKTRIGT